MWLPRFACPDCRTHLVETGVERHACARCGRVFECRGGVWRFLIADVQGHRQQLSRRRIAGQRDVTDARVRRETLHHFLGHVLAAGPSRLRVLDLGAGTGWLSHRLASLGHDAVAVDTVDEEGEGLGAARAQSFVPVQADFDALPLADGQFDLVVFNRSLHYAADTIATLERAHRALVAGGAIVVMDSPMFRVEEQGGAASEDGAGYLTFARLEGAAHRLALQPKFVPSRGPLTWRLRRGVARVRRRRAPAAFGLWVAR